MKKINMKKQISALLVLGFSLAITASFAQDGHKKPIHFEKQYVTKNGKDSTITIITEDRENDVSKKKTLVIHNSDTSVNMIIENNGDKNGTGSTIVFDGDSIVKISKSHAGKGVKIEKKSVIIMNGDSILTANDYGEDVNIMVDTAMIRRKYSNSKAFKNAGEKGITISDKYIIINTKKLSKKDTTHEKWHDVSGGIGIEGFDIGFTQFIDHNNLGVSNVNNLMDLNVGKSVNVNFRVADLRINLISHKLFLDAGLEFDLHDYGFSNNTTILTKGNTFKAVQDSVNFSRDKIATQYFELPLMLVYNSNPKHQDHSFNIGFGGYGGILLGAYSKQVSDSRGLQRLFGNFACNSIDYGVIGQIGVGNVQIFGKYNMSSIFQTSKGAPDLQTITFGIKLFHSFSWT